LFLDYKIINWRLFWSSFRFCSRISRRDT